MSVRIGVSLPFWPSQAPAARAVWDFVERAEALGIDSLWLSDRVTSATSSLEPLTALAAIAGRTQRIKFGTSVLVLPLRNPVIAAKEIATIDFLSGGRMLPVVGTGNGTAEEFEACGSSKRERGGRTDEAMVLLRRLWTEESVTFDGRYFHLKNVSITPKPAQRPTPPLWVGGRSEAALRRAGRLGDGYLVSTMTPDEFVMAVERINRYAQEAEREFDPEHFGALLPYVLADDAADARRMAAPYVLRRRSDTPPDAYSAIGTPRDCIETIQRYVAAGATKFVLRPAGDPATALYQLERLGQEVIPFFHTKK